MNDTKASDTTSTSPTSFPRPRVVALEAPLTWLARGFDDLKYNPWPSLFYGGCFVLGGYLLILAGQRMIERNFAPGFKAWMHQKDLRIVMEEAHRLGLMLPAAGATAQLFNAIVGSGMGEEDSISALKLLEKISAA